MFPRSQGGQKGELGASEEQSAVLPFGVRRQEQGRIIVLLDCQNSNQLFLVSMWSYVARKAPPSSMPVKMSVIRGKSWGGRPVRVGLNEKNRTLEA